MDRSHCDGMRKKEKSAVTALRVKTPVIADARTPEGVKPYIDFIETLRAAPLEALSAEESQKRKGYLKTMARRLRGFYTKNLRATTILSAERPQTSPNFAPHRVTTAKLATLFNDMAAASGNLFLSDVIIAPLSLCEPEGLAKRHYRHKDEFGQYFNHRGRDIYFGTLKVLRGVDATGQGKSNVIVPILMLDTHALDALRQVDGGELATTMLHNLSTVMNIVNHDALHHMTLTALVHETFHRINNDARAVTSWARNMDVSYEGWAHAAHENILLGGGRSLAYAGLLQETLISVTAYFDALEKAAPVLAACHAEDQPRQLLDYFGMVMMHTLSRLYPLDHMIMDEACRRLYALHGEDSMQSVLRAGRDFTTTSDRLRLPRPAGSDAERLKMLVEDVHYCRCAHKVFRRSIFADYDAREMTNPKQGDDHYTLFRKIKNLQLVNISPEDVYNHSPGFKKQANDPGRLVLQGLAAARIDIAQMQKNATSNSPEPLAPRYQPRIPHV